MDSLRDKNRQAINQNNNKYVDYLKYPGTFWYHLAIRVGHCYCISVDYRIHSGSSMEIYVEKNISLSLVLPKPINVTGTAMRVVEESSQPLTIESSTSSDIKLKEISDKTYKRAQFIIGIIITLFIVGLIFYQSTKHAELENISYTDAMSAKEVGDSTIKPVKIAIRSSITNESDSNPIEKSSIEIIYKWKEVDYGGSYIWQLEQDKKSDKYTLTQQINGNNIRQYNCARKKIKRSDEYCFHDVRDESSFTLKVGEEIFFVQNFEDGANAILLITGKTAYMYINDINNNVYDYFATLQSII